MTTITCSLCRKSFDAGPEHCPYCHIRIPGAPRKPAPAVRRPSAEGRLRSTSPRTRRPADTTPLQCPACNHPITREDTWCKWCKWPVNR